MSQHTFEIEQNQIIKYPNMDDIAKEVDRQLSIINASSLVVDEDNVKSIKKLRTELKQKFDILENDRKQIKTAFLKPLEKYELEYKEKIANKFKDADNALKTLIDNVENELKRKKELEVKEYFDDYAFVKNLTFVKYEQANIKVGLADSVKSLKESAKQFIDNIIEDLVLIETQPYKERILVRYYSTLNVKASIAAVLNEVQQEHLLVAKKEVVSDPVIVEVPKVEEIHVPEEVLTVSFTITGTKKQIISVREFMKLGGIKYE